MYRGVRLAAILRQDVWQEILMTGKMPKRVCALSSHSLLQSLQPHTALHLQPPCVHMFCKLKWFLSSKGDKSATFVCSCKQPATIFCACCPPPPPQVLSCRRRVTTPLMVCAATCASWPLLPTSRRLLLWRTLRGGSCRRHKSSLCSHRRTTCGRSTCRWVGVRGGGCALVVGGGCGEGGGM